jgi:hypothetical protein
MGHVNGRTEKTDANVNARHMAEQARLKAVKQLLETAQKIRSFRSVETFKIARDLEIDANNLHNPFPFPQKSVQEPAWSQLIGLIVIFGGLAVGALLFKYARKTS